MSKPFLYFNGDSFTAGVELADDMFPTWPGLTQRKNNSLESWKEYRNFLDSTITVLDDSRLEQYIQLQYDRSWANTLAKILDVNFLNSGLGGSAQEAITHRTIIDFLTLESKGINVDLAIIQLTCPTRLTFYNSYFKGRFYKTNGFDYSLIIPDINKKLKFDPIINKTEEFENFVKQYIMKEDYFGTLVRWLNNLVLLRSFVKTKTGKLPIFVDVGNISLMKSEIQEMLKNESFKNLYLDSGVSESITMINYSDYVMPGGHFVKDMHEAFAKKLAPIIREKIYEQS